MAQRGAFGIYIHFPFCRSKCGYCDFPSVAEQRIPHRAYADAVLAELELRGPQWEGHRLRSVYLGGGTPSLWDREQLRRVLRATLQRFEVDEEVEVTLELNPGSTSDPGAYAGLLEDGVNRLSIGVQSLDDDYLELLQRPHDGRAARMAFDRARQAGFANISCDLIFGLPRQSLDHHLEQIERLIELSPSHLSTYSLTLAAEAPLRRSGVLLPPEELVAEMMERGRSSLADAGFVQYEVSSYARSGLRSVHNSLVWSGRPYLGLGAFAHSMSYRGGKTFRVANPAISSYLRAAGETSPRCIDPGGVVRVAGASLEVVVEPMSRFEIVFLGLRTVDGLDRRSYAQRFGADVLKHYGSGIDRLQEQGLVECDPERVAPTARGIWFADGLAEHLLRSEAEEKPFQLKPDRGR